jgi:hypothetical protein
MQQERLRHRQAERLPGLDPLNYPTGSASSRTAIPSSAGLGARYFFITSGS